jgi:hypothetical protein
MLMKWLLHINNNDERKRLCANTQMSASSKVGVELFKALKGAREEAPKARKRGASTGQARRSANGAQYESQGQARSEAKCVAPGKMENGGEALKEQNKIGMVFRTFSALQIFMGGPGATRLAPLSACPWLSYCAPLALRSFSTARAFLYVCYCTYVNARIS